jgi:hypothetical protein
MELSKATFSKALLAEKIPDGRGAVSQRVEDNAFHLPTGSGNQGELGGADF